MQPAQQRQDLLPDQAAGRVRIRRVDPDDEAMLLAVGRRLVPRDGQQRADDAVLASHLDPAGRATRHDAVEDGLDLVRRRVPGCPQAEALGGRVPERAHPRFGRHSFDAHDPGVQGAGAVNGILIGCRAADAVMHVDGRDVVAEPTHDMPEARRVRTARDEARDAPTRLHEIVVADERLDACCELARHIPSVTEAAAVPDRPSAGAGTGACDACGEGSFPYEAGFSVAASATWSAGGSSRSSALP